MQNKDTIMSVASPSKPDNLTVAIIKEVGHRKMRYWEKATASDLKQISQKDVGNGYWHIELTRRKIDSNAHIWRKWYWWNEFKYLRLKTSLRPLIFLKWILDLEKAVYSPSWGYSPSPTFRWSQERKQERRNFQEEKLGTKEDCGQECS